MRQASGGQHVAEIEIGIYKSGRRAYGFDDIAIVPSRRTRDPEDVDISWEIDAYRFDLPLMAAAMDGVVSPSTAIEIGRLGGLAVLNLEGLWTRYEDPTPLFDEIRELADDKATARMQQMYAEPVQPELVTERIKEMKAAGVTHRAPRSPRSRPTALRPGPAGRRARPAGHPGDGGLGRARVEDGRAAQPEAVHPRVRDPGDRGRLRLLPGRPPPHAHRRGRACWSGWARATPAPPGACSGIGVPQATAIADVAGARMRHLDETGVYCHVIADGGMSKGGDIAKAVACGADAVMLGSPLSSAVEAPARGFHWGMATFHPTLPRGARVKTTTRGTLQEILLGPAHENDGRMNLFGALRTAMATCGYQTVKEFQKAEVMVAPALQTEGKDLQRSQGVGMGH